MQRIIEEALGQFKIQVEELMGDVRGSRLSAEGLTRFEHGLKDRLAVVGGAIEKAVLEEADIEQSSIEVDGRRCYFKYKGPDEYQCLFGKITVQRSVYQANGERTVCPLEMNAGILYHHLTPAAAEFVSYSSAHMVAGELTEFCRRWQSLQPSETVIKHVAFEVGEAAEKLGEIHEAHSRNEEGPAPGDTAVVTISRDATCVNIRGAGWQQAQVGAISLYGQTLERNDEDEDDYIRRERLRTVYMAQMPQERTPTFNAKFEREVEHVVTALPVGCRIACLADGAQSIWKYFESHPILKHAVHIIDYWHTAQYLSKAGQALFGEGSDEAERWFAKYRRVLKVEDGGVQRIIRNIRYHRRKRGIKSRSAKKDIKDVLRFLTRNQKRMQYSEYRSNGIPIGSGVVEAACKTVVGQRLKRAGMRWSTEGGQNILNLRTLVLSRRWDSFWGCHQKLQNLARLEAA